MSDSDSSGSDEPNTSEANVPKRQWSLQEPPVSKTDGWDSDRSLGNISNQEDKYSKSLTIAERSKLQTQIKKNSEFLKNPDNRD